MSIARLMQMARAGVPAGGGGPEVVGIENTVSASGTTPSITLPSGISSGDIIVIFVGVDGTPTASITGFTQDIAKVGGWAASSSYYVFSKTSDGSEGSSVTLTLNASESVCASCWAITGADSIAFSSTANSSTVNPNSPSLTSGFGAVPTFWISSFATDNGSPTISAYPSGYGNGQSLSLSADHGSTRLGVSSKIDSVATEDPPAYTISSAHPAISVTVAVGNAPASSWTNPDLANASYDSVSFSVATEAVQPIDFYIKPDGTRCFVVDITTNTVYQYSLSSAWDMTSASYDSVSFSVSSQGSTARGISFKPDGSKMFIAEASSDNVFQYSLSSSWDLSSASYDSVSYALPTVLTIASGIVFNADGSKFYIPDRGSDYLYEFDLSTAYDMSSASYNSVSINVVSLDNSPESLYFSPSGDKMFLTGSGSDAVNQYSLSSDYDLSTASYDSVSFSVSSQDGFPAGLSFKPDGSKMYILGLIGDTIYQYSTGGAAWTDPDLANASYDSVSFSVSGQDTAPGGLHFKPDGTKVYVMGGSGDDVNEYDLSTAWDVSTTSYLQNFSVASQESNPTGVFFKPDGMKMYMTGSNSDAINEYDLSTAWDVSTASYLQNFSVASQEATPREVFFKPDGTKMYVTGLDGDDVNEYDLSTAWDVSTASYLQNFSVASQETLPTAIFISPTGLVMYILGAAGDDVNEYDLSTAWDVSTASYVQNFSVASQETTPTGLFFKSDGSKMYVVGSTSDTIYQYSTA